MAIGHRKKLRPIVKNYWPEALFLFSFANSASGAFGNINNLTTTICSTKSASAVWKGSFVAFWTDSWIGSF
jgi:hypothetical protein